MIEGRKMMVYRSTLPLVGLANVIECSVQKGAMK